jgi:ABC-type transport system involved in multi-copper enzyme maturation permease subunit
LFLVNWALAAWGTYGGITLGVPQGSGAITTALVFYLMFGLLMLGAMAPTALAEERQRGSLDVLMTSPLSTRAIVVGKWWGAYRMVLGLLPLPLYTAVFLGASWDDLPFYQVNSMSPRPERVTDLDRFLAALFCPFDFLVSGAMIVSLGLLLATWVRRLGRAVALSVIAFFLGAIGLPILVELSFAFIASTLYAGSGQAIYQNRWIMECVTSLSPLVGPIGAIETLQWYSGGPRRWRWVGVGLVVAIKAAISLLLLWLSVKTFDRCLGRVSEAPQPARSRKPVVLEALPRNATETQPR